MCHKSKLPAIARFLEPHTPEYEVKICKTTIHTVQQHPPCSVSLYMGWSCNIKRNATTESTGQGMPLENQQTNTNLKPQESGARPFFSVVLIHHLGVQRLTNEKCMTIVRRESTSREFLSNAQSDMVECIGVLALPGLWSDRACSESGAIYIGQRFHAATKDLVVAREQLAKRF